MAVEPAQASIDGALELRKQLYPKTPPRLADEALADKMTALYRTLLARSGGGGGPVVLLTGLGDRNGASVIARELAKTVAIKLRHRVLLLDATPHASQLASFRVFPNYSWIKAYRDRKSVNDAIYQLGDGSLFVSQMAREAEDLAEVIDAPQTESHFATLRGAFALTVIDAAADRQRQPGSGADAAAWAAATGGGVALAAISDGALLVIESEKTRWQTAARLVGDIENRGGKILGAVLSNRRYPIPPFLYKRL